MKPLSMTIEMKAAEHYFPVVLFFTRFTVMLRLESVDDFLMCEPSNES